MKISLVTKLIAHAKEKYPNACNGTEFEFIAFNDGKKASNASRRCRELVDSGVFERIGGKSVSYRWIPPEKNEIVNYINSLPSKKPVEKIEDKLF